MKSLNLKRIRELREGKGMSMEQAAIKARMSGRQYWHYIESGTLKDIKLSTLERVATVLGVTAKDLLK